MRRHFVSALQRVDIDVRRCDIGVTKSRRNSFYIVAIGKKHGRTCVAKPVELEMTNTMALQKMVKLLRRRLRIHHVAILLGEHVVEIPPSIAEVGDMPILLQTVFRERFQSRSGMDIVRILVLVFGSFSHALLSLSL